MVDSHLHPEHRQKLVKNPRADVVKATPDTPLRAYVRLDELLTMVPFSASTVWRKSKDGSFVNATRLSARITAWNRQAVLQWLEHKEVAR